MNKLIIRIERPLKIQMPPMHELLCGTQQYNLLMITIWIFWQCLKADCTFAL